MAARISATNADAPYRVLALFISGPGAATPGRRRPARTPGGRPCAACTATTRRPSTARGTTSTRPGAPSRRCRGALATATRPTRLASTTATGPCVTGLTRDGLTPATLCRGGLVSTAGAVPPALPIAGAAVGRGTTFLATTPATSAAALVSGAFL